MGSTSRRKLGLAAALLVLCASCSEERVIVPVEGQVFYNGQPLTSGSVMFQPEYGQPARGQIQPDGTFVLTTEGSEDGAVVGKNEVRIAAYEAPPETGNGEAMLGKLLIPRKYTSFATSGLEVEVKPDGNEPFVFRLTGE